MRRCFGHPSPRLHLVPFISSSTQQFHPFHRCHKDNTVFWSPRIIAGDASLTTAPLQCYLPPAIHLCAECQFPHHEKENNKNRLGDSNRNHQGSDHQMISIGSYHEKLFEDITRGIYNSLSHVRALVKQEPDSSSFKARNVPPIVSFLKPSRFYPKNAMQNQTQSPNSPLIQLKREIYFLGAIISALFCPSKTTY